MMVNKNQEQPPDYQEILRITFGGQNGQMALEYIMQVAGMFNSSVDLDPLRTVNANPLRAAKAQDALRIAFNEGKRAVALHLLMMVGRVPFPKNKK
jgi:hypothetical protein